MERKRLKESTTLEKKALKEQKVVATAGKERNSRHRHRRSPSSSSDSSSSYSSRSYSSSSSESSRSSTDDRRRRRTRSYSSSSSSDDSRVPSRVYKSDKNKDAIRDEGSMSHSPLSKRRRGAGENGMVMAKNDTGIKKRNIKNTPLRNDRVRSHSSSCDSRVSETSASRSRSFSRSSSRDRNSMPPSKAAADHNKIGRAHV